MRLSDIIAARFRFNNSSDLKVTQGTLLAGEDQTNDVFVVEQGQFGYERCSASTSTTLGATGAAGDYLQSLLPETAVNGFKLKDGATTIFSLDSISSGVPIEFNIACASVFSVSAGTSTTLLAVGRFT